MIHESADSVLHPENNWFWARCTCGYVNGPFPDPETTVDDLMSHAASYELEQLRAEFERSKLKWLRDTGDGLRIEMLDAAISSIDQRLGRP